MKLSDWRKNAEIVIKGDNCIEGARHVYLTVCKASDKGQNLSVQIEFEKDTPIEDVIIAIVKKREQLYDALISQCTET